MSSSLRFPARQLPLLLVVAAGLFFLWLGNLPLLEPDEGRNVEIAREMLSSGDWITPHYNTLAYLDKPVVFFWLVASSFRLWGLSEWAARFPSALMALGTVLLTWRLARRMFGEGVGLRAGIVLATSPLVIAFSRLVIFDMTLTALITLAMLSFWLAEDEGPRPVWADALAFAAMGIATITKGPVGFLLPLLSLLAYGALGRGLGTFRRMHWGMGLVVFLLVTLPWFYAVSVRNPEFPRYAFWQESLQRFATGRARRTGGFLYYLPIYLLGLFPWSLFLLFAGLGRLKRWREMARESSKPVVFLLAWAGTILVFFSVSQSKLPSYFLPATIPLSILMANAWGEVEWETEGRSPAWLRAGFYALVAVGFAAAAASHPWLFAFVRGRLFGRLHPSLISLIPPSFFYTGLVVIALAVLGRNFGARLRGSDRATASFVVVAVTVPVLLMRWIIPARIYAESVSSRRLARTILESSERDLPIYGYYYFRTGLPFYLRRPVRLVTSDASELTSNWVASRFRELSLRRTGREAGVNSGNWMWRDPGQSAPYDQVLIDAVELRNLGVSRAQPFLVLVRNKQVGEVLFTVGRLEALWHDWEYSVWKVDTSKLQALK